MNVGYRVNDQKVMVIFQRFEDNYSYVLDAIRETCAMSLPELQHSVPRDTCILPIPPDSTFAWISRAKKQADLGA